MRGETTYLLESSMSADQDTNPGGTGAQGAASASTSTARQDNAPADNGMDDPRKSPVAGSGNSLGSGKTANNTSGKDK